MKESFGDVEVAPESPHLLEVFSRNGNPPAESGNMLWAAFKRSMVLKYRISVVG